MFIIFFYPEGFYFILFFIGVWASLIAQSVKNLPAKQETWVGSLGWEDLPGEGNGNPLQYSCLGNPMDRGAWQATVHGVTRVGHDLMTKPPCLLRVLEKTMAPHSSTLAWKIPWMEEPVGLQSMGLLRVRHH